MKKNNAPVIKDGYERNMDFVRSLKEAARLETEGMSCDEYFSHIRKDIAPILEKLNKKSVSL